MHRHAFAVARRGQQPIDRLFVGVGPLVGQEASQVFGSRRQAGQIEGDAAQQRFPAASGDGDSPSCSSRCENEVIDRDCAARSCYH